MTNKERTFMGMPIKGEIYDRRRQTKPRPIEELHASLLAVLTDENIVSVGWTGYTPYFNDGDVCQFGVGDPWFVTTMDGFTKGEYGELLDEDGEEIDEYEMREGLELWSHPHLSERSWDRSGEKEHLHAITFPELAVKCKKFSDDLNSGAFDHDLLAAFGDHCTVTATKDGFQVETYEHD